MSHIASPQRASSVTISCIPHINPDERVMISCFYAERNGGIQRLTHLVNAIANKALEFEYRSNLIPKPVDHVFISSTNSC